MRATIPPDESERLEALAAYDVLDSLPERANLEGPYLRLTVGVLRRGRMGALVAMATPILTYAVQ
jgi:hypothetical protein